MTLTDHIHIEEILAEASAYSLKAEVEATAEQFIAEGYERVDAFVLAFNEWVK